MFLEGVEIAKGRWPQNRREKLLRPQSFTAFLLENAAVLGPIVDLAGQLGKSREQDR
jgi:hypothetical protein